MSEFTGRRVLITGAAGGLGTALASALVGAGAHVIATDRDEAKGVALAAAMPAGPGRLSFELFDQGDPAAVAGFAADVTARHGPVDSLVNNAAIYPKARIEALAPDEAAAVFDVNLRASAAFAAALAPGMRKAGFGRIVNVASITFDLGFEELSAYVATKGGLIGLARVWARELGPDGITVNAISPGAFRTDAEKIHPDPAGYNRFVLDRQAVKRRGVPGDFAHLAMFLLDARTSFITGQVIRVDGGWVTQ